jgi:hypothetical protein
VNNTAVNLPGTFVRCMSGHYYACTRGDEECPHCCALASARQHWQEAQDRLAEIEQLLISITGESCGINTNIELLRAENQRLREALRKDQDRLDWIARASILQVKSMLVYAVRDDAKRMCEWIDGQIARQEPPAMTP